MDVAVVATVFAVILLAELPDKSMIATLVMGSRSSPVQVWAGASIAFVLHTVVAVAAGRLLLLVPHTALEIIVTVLFALGALYLLAVPERAEEHKGEEQAGRQDIATPWRIVATSFGVIALGELGDITQLLTVNFVAKYHAPFSVGVGAGAALVVDAALAAFAGRALLHVLPVRAIRVLGGLVFLGFAGATLYTLLSS